MTEIQLDDFGPSKVIQIYSAKEGVWATYWFRPRPRM